jgi:hypothetical protein
VKQLTRDREHVGFQSRLPQLDVDSEDFGPSQILDPELFQSSQMNIRRKELQLTSEPVHAQDPVRSTISGRSRQPSKALKESRQSYSNDRQMKALSRRLDQHHSASPEPTSSRNKRITTRESFKLYAFEKGKAPVIRKRGTFSSAIN